MPKQTPARKSPSKPPFPQKARDVPATQGMLQLLRSELRAEMRSGFKKVDARFSQMEGRFNGIDARFSKMEERFNGIDARFSKMEERFNGIDARFSKMEERFNGIDAKFDLLHAEIAQLNATVSRLANLMEEQESRNRVVMDGLTGLWQRQEKVETRVDGFEKWLYSLKPAAQN